MLIQSMWLLPRLKSKVSVNQPYGLYDLLYEYSCLLLQWQVIDSIACVHHSHLNQGLVLLFQNKLNAFFIGVWSTEGRKNQIALAPARIVASLFSKVQYLQSIVHIMLSLTNNLRLDNKQFKFIRTLSKASKNV